MSWDFQIVQITAAGTFGTVCVAYDWTSRRFYALKVLKEHFQRNSAVVDRTHDEAAMLAYIRHENVLRVYALLEQARRTIVVMEWIRGCSLQDLLDTAPEGLSGPAVAEVVRQTARGLDAAYHTLIDGKPMGIIHRDLKPSNILVTLDGTVKVVDFGIARGQFQGRSTETDSMVLGARPYMAPERLDGAEDAPSLDVYSLGVIAHELLAGRRMRLSMRPKVHPLQVRDGLEALEVQGFSREGADYLTLLIARMLSYDPRHRPRAGDVDPLIARLLEAQQQHEPLKTIVEDRVRPIFEANSLVDPREHEVYPSLAFIDDIGPTRPGGDSRIDRELDAFLARSDWANHVDDLWRMLLLNPRWTARPFIEWLDAREPRWRFWQANQATTEQRIALLRILGSRIDDAVRVRIRRFTTDRNPAVRRLAKALIEVEEVSTGF